MHIMYLSTQHALLALIGKRVNTFFFGLQPCSVTATDLARLPLTTHHAQNALKWPHLAVGLSSKRYPWVPEIRPARVLKKCTCTVPCCIEYGDKHIRVLGFVCTGLQIVPSPEPQVRSRSTLLLLKPTP
jgi:hypothetical protein